MNCRAFRGLAPALLTVALLLSGCAGTVVHMQELSADRAPGAPARGKAEVVFLRPSGLGFAIQSSVFEVKDGKSLLVGIVAAKAKVAYEVDPGRHLFMSIGENADFMTADLAAGRTYYVNVEPRMGLWKARFGLVPVRAKDFDSDEFKSNLAECKWVGLTDAAHRWARENMESVESKRAEYYPDFLKQPEAERPHLAPDDGR